MHNNYSYNLETIKQLRVAVAAALSLFYLILLNFIAAVGWLLRFQTLLDLLFQVPISVCAQSIQWPQYRDVECSKPKAKLTALIDKRKFNVRTKIWEIMNLLYQSDAQVLDNTIMLSAMRWLADFKQNSC